MENESPMKICEMCGENFESKIGEPYCPSCAKEREEMDDLWTLGGIVARRGFKWVTEAIENETVECATCKNRIAKGRGHKKRVYEGTDFREDSPINYPAIYVCDECY